MFYKWEGSDIAKDCPLTMVKGRFALGSPGCSVVRRPLYRKVVVDCPLVNTSKVELLFRLVKT